MDDVDEDDTGHGYGMYRCYKNIAAVRSSFTQNLPLSALLLGDSELYMVIASSLGVQYHHLMKEANNTFLCGLTYQSFILNEAPSALKGNGMSEVLDYCLLLPELFGGELIDQVMPRNFAVITSKWKELKSDKQFGYCQGIQSMLPVG